MARSMVAMRRVASASRGVIPFQMPQILSQLSQPTPLKNANCRLSVLSFFQRSEMFTMWRGSSHLYLSTMGNERVLILPPGHHVPGQSFIGWIAFRLERQRMTDLVGGQRKRQRHAVLRVAIDSVGAYFRHQLGNRIGPRIPMSRVPWSHIIIGNKTFTPRS